LVRRLEAGSITRGMKIKARCILDAFQGGVERVHVLDGRQPHTVIAELFTDRGVGTLVTKGPP
ncbi:MAG: acetylglutamate kinase, partial [Anaeromyxobacteraceae bacterium]